jgi:hypothetical protein
MICEICSYINRVQPTVGTESLLIGLTRSEVTTLEAFEGESTLLVVEAETGFGMTGFVTEVFEACLAVGFNCCWALGGLGTDTVALRGGVCAFAPNDCFAVLICDG